LLSQLLGTGLFTWAADVSLQSDDPLAGVYIDLRSLDLIVCQQHGLDARRHGGVVHRALGARNSLGGLAARSIGSLPRVIARLLAFGRRTGRQDTEHGKHGQRRTKSERRRMRGK